MITIQSLKNIALTTALMPFLAIATAIADEKLDTHEQKNFETAFLILDQAAKKIWPGWEKTSRQTWYVSNGYEYYICPEKDFEGFKSLGINQSIKCEILARETDIKPENVRTVTIGSTPPTIAIASPRRRNKVWMPWIIAWLHEHTHQWQMSLPDYEEKTRALNLDSPDDTMGSWMINFNFPYEDLKINAAFDAQRYSLMELFTAIKQQQAPKRIRMAVKDYLTEKKLFQEVAGEKNYSFATFQAWQEGTARYTEYKILEETALVAVKNPEMVPIRTIKTLAKYARYKLAEIKKDVETSTLIANERDAFYALGAMESLVLDYLVEDWRNQYADNPYTLDWAFEIWHKNAYQKVGDQWQKSNNRND